MPSPAPVVKPRAPWFAARLAVVALIVWAVIDVIRTTLAVGHYEDRIIVVSHGNVDVLPAWVVYELFDSLMPLGLVTTVADRSWILGVLAAVAAFVAWLYQARRNAGRLGGAPAWASGWAVGGWFIPVAGLVIPYLVVRDVRRAGASVAQPAPVGWWWTGVLVTVLLNRLSWLYDVVTSAGGRFEETTLDTRAVAYPLWTAGTLTVVVTALLSVRVVRRITEAQQWTGEVEAIDPA